MSWIVSSSDKLTWTAGDWRSLEADRDSRRGLLVATGSTLLAGGEEPYRALSLRSGRGLVAAAAAAGAASASDGTGTRGAERPPLAAPGAEYE